MKKIKELGELNSLLTDFMKKGVLSNNFIMQDKYNAYIKAGTLYYERTEAILALFLDCKNCWRIYYHIKDADSDIQLPGDKPLVMELVYRNENDSVIRQLDYWTSKGFSPYINRARMKVTPKELDIVCDNLQGIGFADQGQAEIIQKMIADAFDPYLGCVPCKDEVVECISRKEIITAEDENGRILGLLHIGSKSTTWFVWHLLVLPEARNRGIAKKLLAFYRNMLQEHENSKIQLWVKKDNISARKLYETTGFRYDSWESAGLIKKS
ncbi:MAG: acetyltransferase [Eubacterium sp.]|jgi:ribosomal protein S18 acetylase RimI-like enzyme|nr:acetyltransferase [Eubacterium sp.]